MHLQLTPIYYQKINFKLDLMIRIITLRLKKLPQSIQVQIPGSSGSADQTITLNQMQGLFTNAPYLNNKVYQYNNKQIQQMEMQNLVKKHYF